MGVVFSRPGRPEKLSFKQLSSGSTKSFGLPGLLIVEKISSKTLSRDKGRTVRFALFYANQMPLDRYFFKDPCQDFPDSRISLGTTVLNGRFNCLFYSERSNSSRAFVANTVNFLSFLEVVIVVP